MPGIPFIPSSAPFTPEQRAWLNGYLAGLFADANLRETNLSAANGAPKLPAAKAEALLVLYGSQTGSAERLAKGLATEAGQHGFAPRVMEMNAFAPADLAKESRLVIVTSTWGDGDPPDNAANFWAQLNSEHAPRLEQLHFSVLALGDRNYSDFCGAGKKFDARLEALGGKRIHSRADCDTDYETAAKAWMEGLWPALREVASEDGRSSVEDGKVANRHAVTRPSSILHPPSSSPVVSFSRQNSFPSRLITNRRLNAPGSAKETRHFELALQDSGLNYEVGDALGVLPTNCPALVDEILRALDCDGEEAVKDPQGAETSLRGALLRHYQITKPTPALLRRLVERSGDAELSALLDPSRKADLDQFLYGREVVDFLGKLPSVKLPPAEFISLLAKLQPRLYSIASSPKAHPGEVHLTVAAVRYESHGRTRKGVCSTFLADRVEADTPVPVFVQTSHGFRLPADATRPVIMVGPGTGIAPFRAFLEERRAVGAQGRNWLFFGDQRKQCDFLYQEQLESMRAEGSLTRLDTAFSRDQAEKIYVQDRMLENAKELWAWLEAGAHFYVCGDAKRMAKDVDAALHRVIECAGSRTAEQAEEYVRKLKTDKRYQRDVY
jgi:sulfite reductase (NADPH) flavoprotein alpha-component